MTKPKLQFLHKMAKETKKNRTLRQYLHKTMPFKQEPRPRHILHASELTKEDAEYCPREMALSDAYHIKGKSKWVDTCLSYTFKLGHAMADVLCEDVLGDIAVANWRCSACGHIHHFQLKPKKCAKCDCRHNRYVEYRFRDPISGASCGVDLFLNLPGRPKLTPVEIKTAAESVWVGLSAPLSEHRIRTLLYMEIMARSNDPVTSKIDYESAIVFYMLKGYGKKDDSLLEEGLLDSLTPFKEYELDRNPDAIVQYLGKAEAYKLFRLEGVVPDRLDACPSATSKRAKKCKTCKECFSNELPAGSIIEPLGMGDLEHEH